MPVKPAREFAMWEVFSFFILMATTPTSRPSIAYYSGALSSVAAKSPTTLALVSGV